MRLDEFKHSLRNALRPGYLPTMAGKLVTRLREGKVGEERRAALALCAAHRSDLDAFAAALDPELWRESQQYAARLEQHAEAVLTRHPDVRLGGGGAYHLLYFLVRLTKPEVVVETGVAAGYSSHAILSALRRNGRGRLYSSDFPYFRLKDPERYIGILVDEELRDRWELFVRGDQANLPVIAQRVDSIDLLHYDSDKSSSGRAFALATLQDRLTDRSVVVMDDIQDTPFFFDYAKRRPGALKVFEFNRKYVGLVGV